MSLLYLSLTSAISPSSVNFPLNQSPDGCPKIVRPTAKPLTKGALADASNTALNLSSVHPNLKSRFHGNMDHWLE